MDQAPSDTVQELGTCIVDLCSRMHGGDYLLLELCPKRPGRFRGNAIRYGSLLLCFPWAGQFRGIVACRFTAAGGQVSLASALASEACL